MSETGAKRKERKQRKGDVPSKSETSSLSRFKTSSSEDNEEEERLLSPEPRILIYSSPETSTLKRTGAIRKRETRRVTWKESDETPVIYSQPKYPSAAAVAYWSRITGARIKTTSEKTSEPTVTSGIRQTQTSISTVIKQSDTEKSVHEQTAVEVKALDLPKSGIVVKKSQLSPDGDNQARKSDSGKPPAAKSPDKVVPIKEKSVSEQTSAGASSPIRSGSSAEESESSADSSSSIGDYETSGSESASSADDYASSVDDSEHSVDTSLPLEENADDSSPELMTEADIQSFKEKVQQEGGRRRVKKIHALLDKKYKVRRKRYAIHLKGIIENEAMQTPKIGEETVRSDTEKMCRYRGSWTAEEAGTSRRRRSGFFRPKERHFKVLMLGRYGCGKTSIVNQYLNRYFCQTYAATIGADCIQKTLPWNENNTVKLHIWDIEGQEHTETLTRTFFKAASGAVAVYDVTSKESFKAVTRWKHELDSKVSLPDGSPLPCILLANKCDLDEEGTLDSCSDTEFFCQEYNFATYFKTSARCNINIDEAFLWLSKKMMENRRAFKNRRDLLQPPGSDESGLFLRRHGHIYVRNPCSFC